MAENTNVKNFAPVLARLATAREALPTAEGERLATVAEQIEAISRGDFAGCLRQASPQVELEIFAPPDFPFVCRARGAEALRDAMLHNFGAVEDQKPVISNVLVQGDVVVMFGTERGRIRATGVLYHVEFVHRFTFASGALQNIRIIAARTP